MIELNLKRNRAPKCLSGCHSLNQELRAHPPARGHLPHRPRDGYVKKRITLSPPARLCSVFSAREGHRGVLLGNIYCVPAMLSTMVDVLYIIPQLDTTSENHLLLFPVFQVRKIKAQNLNFSP